MDRTGAGGFADIDPAGDFGRADRTDPRRGSREHRGADHHAVDQFPCRGRGDYPDLPGRRGNRPGCGAKALLGQHQHRDGRLFAPFFGILAYTHYVSGWIWPQAEIAGIALSTTSVAVVYAVMVETGFNRTEMGKLILAACFVNDLGTVLALALIFANYNIWMAVFLGTMVVVLCLLPKFSPWFFAKVGNRVSEPDGKFILLVLFGLGGLGNIAKSEAVLPAYLVGMVLARYFLKEQVLSQRLRVIAFTLLTPFYFLKAGSLVKSSTVGDRFRTDRHPAGRKNAHQVRGIWPLTKGFRFGKREGMYTTLMMSTGLTFGSISALFGLTNGIINQDQYTVLVTAVIGMPWSRP